MKLRHPFYTPLALGLVIYLLLASHFGWSFYHSLAGKAMALRGPNTQHK